MAQKPRYAPTVVHQYRAPTVGFMIDRYSEQLVFKPLVEIHHWFAYSRGAHLLPGYPPLFYTRRQKRPVSPNKSAIAAVGEGVAGLLAQREYRCRRLARPNHDYPDAVMDSTNETYLVEAKASLSRKDLERTLEEELLRMATYVSACATLDVRPVAGLIVGTHIETEVCYRSLVTKVTV
jgi:hypothetical protein